MKEENIMLCFEEAKKYKKEIKKLYREAFPADERAPFFMLLKRTEREENSFYAITDENGFSGLVYTMKSEKVIYIFFLAVLSQKRGKGYGTEILSKIRNMNPDRAVILMIEDTGITDAPNYEERIDRLGFYKKNGFYQLGIKINEAGVNYELLGTNRNVVLEDFLSIMKKFLGKLLFKYIYRKMKIK